MHDTAAPAASEEDLVAIAGKDASKPPLAAPEFEIGLDGSEMILARGGRRVLRLDADAVPVFARSLMEVLRPADPATAPDLADAFGRRLEVAQGDGVVRFVAVSGGPLRIEEGAKDNRLHGVLGTMSTARIRAVIEEMADRLPARADDLRAAAATRFPAPAQTLRKTAWGAAIVWTEDGLVYVPARLGAVTGPNGRWMRAGDPKGVLETALRAHRAEPRVIAQALAEIDHVDPITLPSAKSVARQEVLRKEREARLAAVLAGDGPSGDGVPFAEPKEDEG